MSRYDDGDGLDRCWARVVLLVFQVAVYGFLTLAGTALVAGFAWAVVTIIARIS